MPKRLPIEAPTAELRLLGGQLCLDFCNTVDPREGPRAHDHLRSYLDVLAWAASTKILTTRELARLRVRAAREPEAARTAFRSTLGLRETLYRIFTSVVREQPVPRRDLPALAAIHAQAFAHSELIETDGSFIWASRGSGPVFDRPSWRVVQSAAELLTSSAISRLGMCAAAECGWIFLDLSKSHTRRWCSMEGCGSREKMRRFYARHRLIKRKRSI